MVGVLGGHANAQRVQDTVGVVEAEGGRRQLLSHRLSLRTRAKELGVFKQHGRVRAGDEMLCSKSYIINATQCATTSSFFAANKDRTTVD